MTSLVDSLRDTWALPLLTFGNSMGLLMLVCFCSAIEHGFGSFMSIAVMGALMVLADGQRGFFLAQLMLGRRAASMAALTSGATMFCFLSIASFRSSVMLWEYGIIAVAVLLLVCAYLRQSRRRMRRWTSSTSAVNVRMGIDTQFEVGLKGAVMVEDISGVKRTQKHTCKGQRGRIAKRVPSTIQAHFGRDLPTKTLS